MSADNATAAKEEQRRQDLLEDAARMQIYFGHTELVSQRMPGLVRDGGVCKEHFPDRDLEGRWTGAGLTKRVDFLSQIPLPPVRAADEEALAKAEKVRVLPSWFPCRLFLGPGFRLGARRNRLVEPVKTRKKREKTGENGRDTV